MPIRHAFRFTRFALTLLLCGLLWLGLGCVSLAADLTASDGSPTVFFDDTDNAVGSDWGITGAQDGFAIFRADGGGFSTVFHIDSSAPSPSLWVNNVGNVGLGTSTPAQKLHMVSGDTPSLRFEQNGSMGLTPYTWEVGHNSSIFFVFDAVTSRVPFTILPGAPTGSLRILSNGRVGLGTLTPQGNLHIFGNSNQDIFNGIGPDLNSGPAFNFGYAGASFGAGTGFFNVRGANSGVNPSLRFATVNTQRMIITNAGRVGIGNLAPSQALDVTGNIRASGSFIAGGTTLNVPDYVFEPDYKLMPLTELGSYVAKEKHLPDIPSAQEIKQQGVNVSELQMQFLKKIEELTLYTVEQERTIRRQEQASTHQEGTIQELKEMVAHLTARVAMLEHGTATPKPRRHP